jgi:mannose-1-phosphate guanylyltransferase
LYEDALIDLDIGAAVGEHKDKGAVSRVVALDVPPDQVQYYVI